MTAITYFHNRTDAFLARLMAGAKSFGEKFVAARQMQAQRIVNGYLASMDDEALAHLGIDRKTIEKAPKAYYPDF